MKIISMVSMLMAVFFNGQIAASEVLIEKVDFVRNSNANYSFSVTLKHADKGWDHYANVWQVQSLTGEVLAKRVLHHPHVNEQPFTRSLSNVVLPDSIEKVVIVAGCIVDGVNSQKFTVSVKQ